MLKELFVITDIPVIISVIAKWSPIISELSWSLKIYFCSDREVTRYWDQRSFNCLSPKYWYLLWASFSLHFFFTLSSKKSYLATQNKVCLVSCLHGPQSGGGLCICNVHRLKEHLSKTRESDEKSRQNEGSNSLRCASHLFCFRLCKGYKPCSNRELGKA